MAKAKEIAETAARRAVSWVARHPRRRRAVRATVRVLEKAVLVVVVGYFALWALAMLALGFIILLETGVAAVAEEFGPPAGEIVRVLVLMALFLAASKWTLKSSRRRRGRRY